MKTAIPVQQGENYDIRIERLGTSGEGVGRYDNFTVFVPNALPGEQVSARVEEVKKTYARARIMEIRVASADRVRPRHESP